MNKKQEKTKITKFDKSISRLRRRVFKHVWLTRFVAIILLFLVLYGSFVGITSLLKNTPIQYYFGLSKAFVFTPENSIKSNNNQTDLLVLGKSGGNHEGPDLTDTMIFASVPHDKEEITLISLPRDIWIEDLRAKINSAYYWGNKKKDGGGFVLAKSTVEEVLGQPVQYAMIIDFSGFEKIIDKMGGIEVDVEHSFVDTKYPIAGKENDECGGTDPDYRCRYETIEFTTGTTHMDGETALKFVRSRNAEGDEGTDLARAARQQKIIQAMKNKALSPEIILHPKRALAVWEAVKETIDTDAPPEALAVLSRRAFDARDDINSYVLPEMYLEVPPYVPEYDNLYVFIPRKENDEGERVWDEIHQWVEDTLN